MKKAFAVIVFFLSLILRSNEVRANDIIHGKLPYVNVSTGLLIYQGDLSYVRDVGYYYNPTLGYELGASYLFWDALEVELGLFGGVMTHEQRTTFITTNFKTSVVGAGLNLAFYFDNGFIMKKGSVAAPYIYAGISPQFFFPYIDYRHDASGAIYHYWSDGTIRSQAERGPDASSAVVLERDYSFEKSARGFGNQFSTTLRNIKAGFGVKFRINSWASAEAQVDYNFTNTDYLDGEAIGQGKDGYFYTSLGAKLDLNEIKAILGAKSSEEKEEVDDINVKDFLTIDSDGDGVPDVKDDCNATPPKAKVDAKGCSTESEKVAEGVDSMAMMADSLIVLREKLCRNYPILCGESDQEYSEVNERSKRKKEKLPEAKQEKKKPSVSVVPGEEIDVTLKKIVSIADVDGNGKVELPELYQAIEEFFDDANKLSLEEIRKLIDHFFDQY